VYVLVEWVGNLTASNSVADPGGGAKGAIAPPLSRRKGGKKGRSEGQKEKAGKMRKEERRE